MATQHTTTQNHKVLPHLKANSLTHSSDHFIVPTALNVRLRWGGGRRSHVLSPARGITVCHTLCLRLEVVVVTKATAVCEGLAELRYRVVVPANLRALAWPNIRLQTANT